MSDITGEEFGERVKAALGERLDAKRWSGLYGDALTYIGELEEANAHNRVAIESLRAEVARKTSDWTLAEKEVDYLRAEVTKIRAYAARNMHDNEDPEYPMSKAGLRRALSRVCRALELIATDRIPEGG